MSIAEIIAELRRMTTDERREVARVLVDLTESGSTGATRAADFAAAKQYVLENYGELLQRLATDDQITAGNLGDSKVAGAMDAVFEKHRDLMRRLAE
jgi:transcription elongation GreA/GreB family factor